MMKNDDLISRKALIEQIEEDAKHMMFTSHHDHMLHDDMVEFAVNAVECAPSVDAEPVRHATWRKDISGKYVFCTACYDSSFGRGCFAFPNRPEIINWRYCPICGAKIDKEE